jgi:hypothetical protein
MIIYTLNKNVLPTEKRYVKFYSETMGYVCGKSSGNESISDGTELPVEAIIISSIQVVLQTK